MEMQPETTNVHSKCRCCLLEGEHPHNISDHFYTRMFKETFNISPATDWRLPQWMCSGCVDSLKEAKRFRDMVTETEEQLLEALSSTHAEQYVLDTSLVKDEDSDTVSVDLKDLDLIPSPEDELPCEEPEIEVVIKTEGDEQNTLTIEPTVVERRVTRQSVRISNGKNKKGKTKKASSADPLPFEDVPPEAVELGNSSFLNNFAEITTSKPDQNNATQIPNFDESDVSEGSNDKNYTPSSSETSSDDDHDLVMESKCLDGSYKDTNTSGQERKKPPSHQMPSEEHSENDSGNDETIEEHVTGKIQDTGTNISSVVTEKETTQGMPSAVAEAGVLEPDVDNISCKQELDQLETIQGMPSAVAEAGVLKLDSDNVREQEELDELVSGPRHRSCGIEVFNLRKNIIQTLLYSTIMPFRYTSRHVERFKCFYCDNTYEMKELRKHTESQHADKASEETLMSLLKTRRCISIHAEISRIKCTLCNDEFKSVETLIEHLIKVHEKVYPHTQRTSRGILSYDLSSGDMKCHLCNDHFNTFQVLSAHMNQHYGDFVCRVCHKKFTSKYRCRSHLMRVHVSTVKEQMFICDYCKESFKNRIRLIYHMRTKHLGAVIKCQFCPKTFLQKDDLDRALHMTKEHNAGRITSFQCAICGYITPRQRRFDEHMDTHNGVKNNKCEVCGKRYGTRATLKAHMRCHSDEKKFACSVCGAAFRHPSGLKHHSRRQHHDSKTK